MAGRYRPWRYDEVAMRLQLCFGLRPPLRCSLRKELVVHLKEGSFLSRQSRPPHNTFCGNLDCGIDASDEGQGWANNNIIWEETPVIGCGNLILLCNDYLNLASGCPGDGGFSLDPQFCGIPGSGNVYLQSDSPCAPGNDPLGGYCGLIGALPVGCGTSDVKKMTWGEIKAGYEE
jgi:hypothetical protein